MSAKLFVPTKEYLYCQVTAWGPDAGDLTTLPVYLAFLDAEDEDLRPGSDEWMTAEWVPDSEDTARILIDTLSDLVAGEYMGWMWVDGAIEAPVRPVGTVVVS